MNRIFLSAFLAAYLVVSGVSAQTLSEVRRMAPGAWTVNIMEGAPGCAVAIPNDSIDDTAAIQCMINYVRTTYDGGTIGIPQGIFTINSSDGLDVRAKVWLEGLGESSILQTTIDSSVVRFTTDGTSCPGGNHFGGMEKLQVLGYTGVTKTNGTVDVRDNCNVVVRDNKIFYGQWGLIADGVDSFFENNFIWGYTGAVNSRGANWHYRCKYDQPGPDAATYGIFFGANIAGLTLPENVFYNCDFSGSYTYSVYVQDTGNSGIYHFTDPVFSSPIRIDNARVVMIAGAEIGSTSFVTNNGNVIVVGSYALTATTITGTGGKTCAGTVNLTC